jgi:hypothetical protein
MRRWGLLLSIVLVLAGLSATNPTAEQLYGFILPKAKDHIRREVTKPSGSDRALENAGNLFGPLGAALAGGIVGANQADRELAALADFRQYFFSHLTVTDWILFSRFDVCIIEQHSLRSYLGAAGTFVKLRGGTC